MNSYVLNFSGLHIIPFIVRKDVRRKLEQIQKNPSLNSCTNLNSRPKSDKIG